MRSIVRLLKLLLRRRSPPRELFVHEDDWGQIEVLPASCAAWCAQEIARLSTFAAEHEAPGGNGWTDMYVRQPAPKALAGLAIPFDDAVMAMAQFADRQAPRRISLRDSILGHQQEIVAVGMRLGNLLPHQGTWNASKT